MKRPFRLEIEEWKFITSTFSSQSAAEASVGAVLGRWRIKPGTPWKIVERRREMGPRGREREVRVVVAEGVA